MSAADFGIGDPSAPRQSATLVVRVQAIAARLGARATRLLEPDESVLAAWVAAFAAAPQAVPNLPRPPNKRLTRLVVGVVVAAHIALLVALYLRSSPPPPPEAEMTVELVRDMPEADKPKPPEGKPAPTPLQRPVQAGKNAEHKETTQQGQQEQQDTKSSQHQAKQEPKPQPKTEARQPKPARERQPHRAPPPKAQPKEDQDQQKALEEKKQEKAQEELKQAQEQQQQERQQELQHQERQRTAPDASQAPRGPGLDMPAIALPGATDAGTEAVSYPQLVLSQVAKAKKEGRYMGVPGYAGVRFRVAEDGSLEMVKLVSSSGDPNLDIEAEAMIRRAAPFPKPPAGGRRDYGITLVFKPQS